MHPPTPQRLHTWRLFGLIALRAASISLAAVGLYLVTKRVLFALGSGMGLKEMLTVWEGIGEQHSFYRGVAMLVVSAALGAAATRLARWLVPVVPFVCPKCGYGDAPTDDPARCPECATPGVFPRSEPTHARP